MKELKETFADPQILSYELKKRKKDLIFWVGAVLFICLIYFFVSSKDFSFLLVLSSMVQMLSFIIIIIKVWSYRNCSGISLNTVISYILILFSRLSSTLFYNGYLPSDEAGDWFYQLTEIVSLLSLGFLYYIIARLFKDTYNSDLDVISWKYMALPSVCLALIAHTHLNKNLITDVLWCSAMYLEAVAIFPQIYLFHQKMGQIESFTSHYVAFQGFSRVFSLIFWWNTYEELVDNGSEGYSLFQHYVGYLIILSQIIQLVIMVEFFYLYFKALIKGEKMTLESMI